MWKNTKSIVVFPLQQRISDLATMLRYTYISSLVMYYRHRYAPKTEAFSFARVVDRLYALPTHHALGDSVIWLSIHLQIVYRLEGREDNSNCIISIPITEDLRCLQDFKQQDALKKNAWQTWREKTLNKQLWRDVKGWSSNLGVGQRTNILL
jgi:hypothetical protein